MKKIFNKIIFLTLFCFLIMPLFAQGNGIPFKNPIEKNKIEEVIAAVVLWLYAIAFALVPMMILIGAFYILTAAGDPEKINTGKKIILWTIVGLGIVILSTGVSELIKNLLETTTP